ncbi:CAP Gly-rich domain-containing protein [Paraphysoderma sedebokerense]|nr:CAP Gly-rich domain-containing protein [Paraphysoderma sedebokerense]
MSILTLFVSSQNTIDSERRFDKGLSIASLKAKLEPITGVPAETQLIKLYNGDSFITTVEGDDYMLGAFPVENFMRLHVIDTNPYAKRNEFSDLSQVEKFEMKDDDYDKLHDSVRAFKRRNKIGRFDDARSSTSSNDDAFEEEASNIKIGNRCEVDIGDGNIKRRGTIMYVGKTEFKPGYWIGVKYDEPYGKHDGTHLSFETISVEGKSYFSCPNKYGAFVRPNKVTVGDFPEEEIDLDDLDEM